MPALERTLRSLAGEFARELLATLRGVGLEDLLDITESPRPRAEAHADRRGRKTRGSTPTSAIGIDRAIAETARARRLNERETAILTLSVRGATRSAISSTLGSNENTMKTQTRALLRKLGVPSLSDAAIAVLHHALGSTGVVLPLQPK